MTETPFSLDEQMRVRTITLEQSEGTLHPEMALAAVTLTFAW